MRACTRFLAVILFCLLSVTAAAQPGTYPATLSRVIDGDTYVLLVELNFDVLYRATIRLEGLDTPERFTPEGKLATAAAEALLRSGPITVEPIGRMSFARHVARVYVGGVDVAARLRADGHAKKVPR